VDLYVVLNVTNQNVPLGRNMQEVQITKVFLVHKCVPFA